MNVRKASLVLIAVAFGLLCFSFILATIIVTKEGGWVCPDRPEEPWFWNSTEHHLKTNAFKIEGSEWRITWVAFSGYITESTQAWIRVYDAYTDKLIREVTLTYKNDEAYLNCRGRFYMEIDVYGPVKEWGVYVNEYVPARTYRPYESIAPVFSFLSLLLLIIGIVIYVKERRP